MMIFPAALFNTLVLTLIGNLWIPNIIGQEGFSQWRQVLTVLAYAGLAHIGFADGLQSLWVENKGRPKLSFIMIIIPITLLSLLIYWIYTFLVGKNQINIAFLFILTTLNPFFVNYIVSHSKSIILVKFYTIQILFYGIFVYLGVHIFHFSGLNIPVFGQIFLICLGIICAFWVYSKDQRKVEQVLTARDIFIKYRGASLYFLNLTLITIFSFDRITALYLLSKEDQSQYFFLSLPVTLASTTSLLFSGIIFSRNIFFSKGVIILARVFSISAIIAVLLIPDIWLKDIIHFLYRKFDTGNLTIFLCSSVVVFYFSVFLLPEIRRYFVRPFILSSFALAIIFFVFSFFLVSDYLTLATSYFIYLTILVIFMELLINSRPMKLFTKNLTKGDQLDENTD